MQLQPYNQLINFILKAYLMLMHLVGILSIISTLVPQGMRGLNQVPTILLHCRLLNGRKLILDDKIHTLY